jgi:hypothetical protein
MVDAENGDLLYCTQLLESVAARGNVYHVHGAIPREITDFPRALADYDLPVPADSSGRPGPIQLA